MLLVPWTLPLFSLVLLSLQPEHGIAAGRYWQWPRVDDAFANLSTVLDTGFPRFLLNSLIIAGASVIGVLCVSTLASYAIATTRLHQIRWLLIVFVIGNLAPPQILMIPVLQLMIHAVPLYNTHAALVLFHISFQTGFCVFFLTGFIMAVPRELLDAARADGASEMAVFRSVVLPALRPALAALAALEFTFIWNDYFWSLVLVQSDGVRPVTAALQTLKGMYASSAHLLAGVALLAAIVPAAMFVVMQRYFIRGLTGGALNS
jgi:multiple sugar transport system permease protein